MKKIPTMVPVVAVALIDADGRVLMQQRRFQSEHGGLWEFPGGKVEPGESLTEALLREIAEELGLALSAGQLEPFSFASLPGSPYVILLYTCRSWSGEPACLEGEAVSWFTPQELNSLAMPPLDVPLAKALENHLARTN
jgi:8-oxo-dGTP diphosphatase